MSESLCKVIQRYEDKKYYGLCLFSSFLLTWLIVAFTGFAEILSLFSNKHLGSIEAFLFTQIDLLSFQRSGIEILPNNNWRSVANDTFLNSFRYWYSIIYIALWLIAFRLLVSKNLNTLVLGINFQKTLLSIKSIALNLMVAAKQAISSILHYVKLELKNLNDVKGIAHSAQKEKVNRLGVEEESNVPEYKECHFCCEQILYRAIKCKHCGSELKPIAENGNEEVVNATSILNNTNSDITWKHYAGIGVVIIFIFYAMVSGSGSISSKLDEQSAKTLCRSYIAKLFYKPTSIIQTEHIKYDGGHFVKAYYYRPSDGDYFEYVCSLDNNTIIWAAIFNGSELGRWRYEDEMNYKKNTSGSWVLN